jgi:hypothetical protein
VGGGHLNPMPLARRRLPGAPGISLYPEAHVGAPRATRTNVAPTGAVRTTAANELTVNLEDCLMPAPSFSSPMAALETLRPEALGSLADALAKVVGLPVEAAMPPWLMHQAAGSAVVDHVLRLDPSLRRGQAIVQVAVANPHWFREGSFRRNTNRRAARRLGTERSHNLCLPDGIFRMPTEKAIGRSRDARREPRRRP